MAPIRTLVAGLRRLFRKKRAERDLDDEVRHFIEMAANERIQQGMDRDAAYRAARIELGGVEPVKEQVRRAGWEAALESLWQDIRFGARGLRRSPGFTLVALLTLALGIGANTAMFTVVEGVILRPLPYRDPDRLVMVWSDDVQRGLHESATAIPTIEAWRSDTTHLEGLAIYRGNSATVSLAGTEPDRVRTAFVEPGLFALLGVAPAAGRLFSAEENAPGANVVVITSTYAARHFNGDPVGKTLVIDGDMNAWKQDPRTVRIVGVLPSGFYFPAKDVEIFEPLRVYWRYASEAIDRDGSFAWNAVGRLRPGVTAAGAATSLTRIGDGLAAAYPKPASKDFPGYAVNAVPLLDGMAGRGLQASLWMLLAMVGFVLLIACVNVANLVVARGSARAREFAIRTALGAGRMRIVRQLLVESLLLAGCGGLLGLGLGVLTLPALVALAPPSIPRLDELVVDGRVLAFTILVACAAALVFGLAPAWHGANAAPHRTIKGAPARPGRRWRLSGALVVVECALAVMLVAGAGLLLRSFQHVQQIDPGFNPSGLLVVRVSPPQQPPAGLRGVAVFQYKVTRTEALLERVAQVRGVTSVGLTGGLMMDRDPDGTITFAGEAGHAGRTRSQVLYSNGATPGFFETIGARLLAGRFLTVDDQRFAPTLLYTSEDTAYTGRAQAVVVNDAFVHTFLPGSGAIGVRFYEGNPGKPFWYEIVGVIASVRTEGLEAEPAPHIYGSNIGGVGDLIVRTTGDPLAAAGAIRAAIQAVAAGTVVSRVSTGDEQLGTFTAQRRFQTFLLTVFASLALCLAAVGIFGVMRHSVERRRREVGVRLALGASRSSIARLVIGEGLALAAAGVAIGLGGAWLTAGVLSHWLFGVTATDPFTLIATVLILLFAALLACWVPAHRATTVDPVLALRAE